MNHYYKVGISLLTTSLLLAGANGAVCFSRHPILILATNAHFGSYTAEILMTEGFNEFQMDSLDGANISLKYLKEFDIVILSRQSLTEDQKKMFAQYVKSGGNLIAFNPDTKLNDVFGITDTGGAINEAYIAVSPESEIGKGITTQSLQVHVTTDRYKLNGGREVAALFKDDSTASEFSAVVVNDYGKGHAVAFSYNLPENIIYTRQGNYRHAGQEMDGILGIRAMDMFTRGWINTSKNILNQADEQMRLLSHCVEKMNSYTKPLPRFWYFPDTLKCLVTLNNDGEDSKEAEFGPQFADVDSKGAKMTLYIKETDFISKDWVTSWSEKGFEIGGHPDDTKQAVNPDWETMDGVFSDLNKKLNSKYGLPSMQTVTNHWFVWCGKNASRKKSFAAQARIEEKNGIGLDCNYAHYDNNSNQGHFLGALGTDQGNYTGSGLAMKFSDIDGKIINVYQQLNNVYDQQYMESKDPDGYFNCFKGLMDRSLSNEVYSTISVKAHNNEYFFSKGPLMNMLEYAKSRGVPVWTELKLLEFLKMKEDASFTDISWSGSSLSFKIQSTRKFSNGLTCLVLFRYNGRRINSIIHNGMIQPYTVMSIKGFDYARFTITPGTNHTVSMNYLK